MDCVLGDDFVDAIRSTNVGLVGLSARSGIFDKTRDILRLVSRLSVQNIVYWNLDAALKLVLTKAMECWPTRIIDVSPGPMLFDELDSTSALQQRIAFSASDYMRRLDHFVAKYADGLPPERFGQPKSTHVVPNGVAVPTQSPGGARAVRPREVDPRFALVTCCRIAPNKRLEVLVEMMKVLSRKLPKASLTIVGGMDQRHVGYFEGIKRLIEARGIRNIYFAGPSADVFNFLDQFRVFVMISRNQGCPNASLEAMAMGLPVIANSDGGTAEQVLHGRTGFLSEVDDPETLASYAIQLLTDQHLARRLGNAAREHVRRHFSLESMGIAYLKLLARDPT